MLVSAQVTCESCGFTGILLSFFSVSFDELINSSGNDSHFASHASCRVLVSSRSSSILASCKMVSFLLSSDLSMVWFFLWMDAFRPCLVPWAPGAWRLYANTARISLMRFSPHSSNFRVLRWGCSANARPKQGLMMGLMMMMFLVCKCKHHVILHSCLPHVGCCYSLWQLCTVWGFAVN